MPPYRRHVFICVNRRPEGHPKGCCAEKGSEAVRALFKERLRTLGLNRIVRANAAGCLDACALGTTVVIYPEGVWYGGVTTDDVEEIIDSHILGGEVVARLLMRGTAAPDGPLPPIARETRGEETP